MATACHQTRNIQGWSTLMGMFAAVGQVLMVMVMMMYVLCRLPRPAYWTAFRNRVDLFQLLLLSNVSAARRHLNFYLQMFGGDSQAMMTSQASDPLLQEINTVLSTPRELRDLCRLSIRSRLAYCASGCGILRRMSELPLPRSLVSYLSYVTEMKDG